MVEIGRLKMSSKNSSTVVKVERRDDQEEIDQLAAKMVEANRVKMANLSSSTSTLVASQVAPMQRSVTGTLLNYFSRSSIAGATATTTSKEAEVAKEKKTSSLDQESAKGRFGWTDSPVHIPYIYRREEKLCSVRIFEHRVLKMFSTILRPELYSCVSIKSHYITDLEARLLNEINAKHCEWQYGRELFTVRDLIVNLADAMEFFKFLQTCQNKLVHKSCNPQDRCGFFRIGGESVVPYTVVNSIKYVPLFYFEGETGNLDKRAIQVVGWDLAYLKFCCKVQGIRNELFSNDSYAAVSVDDIKQQFPAHTDLQLFWPSRSLLDVQSTSSINQSIGSWIQKPRGNPPALPTATVSSVIQKNPATSQSTAAAVKHHQPSVTISTASATSVLLQASAAALPSRSTALPTRSTAATSHSNPPTYNGWNSLALQQLQQQQSESNNSAAHLSSVLQQSNRTGGGTMLMPSLQGSVHGVPVNMGLNMSAATALGMHYAQAALLSMQSRTSAQQPPVSAHSALDSLLRANGVHSDHLRPPHGSSSATLMNRTTYSASQSPLTGAVPGSSPHSRNSTGASPRPGLPVPSANLVNSNSGSSSLSSCSVAKPPPPLIPVNGNHPLFSSMSAIVSPPSRLSDNGQQHNISRSGHPQQQQQHHQNHHQHHHQQQQQQQHQLLQQQQQQQQQPPPPFKLQRLPIENQMVPCVNSRQYVYNNLMMALPDMAAYLFPHLGHQACKQVLQDGLGVTLYEANPQQLHVLSSAGKISNVNSFSGEKVSLVNVRDVVKFMPQIRYMMSRLDVSELSHAHSSKRQRVS